MAKSKARWLAIVLAVAALIVVVRMLPLGVWFQAFSQWVTGQGLLGFAAFVGVYALCAVLFVPGSVLTIAAGAIFGVLWGSIAVSVAATLGASMAFLIGRYLMRRQVEGWAAKNPRFAAVDRAVGREGWKIVLLTRLSPIFPFNLLNYLYGLTGVELRHYVVASWIGMMPGTVLYVYLGFIGGEVARASSGGGGRTPQEYALWGIGLLATVAVTAYVTRVARRALQEKTA
jgi:uncharacterized membrane protein YdjX (TVP38/TMEM64 family)